MAETIIIRWKGWIDGEIVSKGHHVIDVTKDSNYFKSDIDFIVDSKTAELKTDTIIWRTNNLFIEDEIFYYNGEYYG